MTFRELFDKAVDQTNKDLLEKDPAPGMFTPTVYLVSRLNKLFEELEGCKWDRMQAYWNEMINLNDYKLNVWIPLKFKVKYKKRCTVPCEDSGKLKTCYLIKSITIFDEDGKEVSLDKDIIDYVNMKHDTDPRVVSKVKKQQVLTEYKDFIDKLKAVREEFQSLPSEVKQALRYNISLSLD